LARRQHRDLHRMPARLQDAAPNRVGRQLQVHVAGVLFRPGIEDANDRLADVVLRPPTRLLGAGTMAKGTQFIPAVPAPGAELFRGLAGHADEPRAKSGESPRSSLAEGEDG